ncbi:hypothetical protein [Streptomyces sp. TE33382]
MPPVYGGDFGGRTLLLRKTVRAALPDELSLVVRMFCCDFCPVAGCGVV